MTSQSLPGSDGTSRQHQEASPPCRSPAGSPYIQGVSLGRKPSGGTCLPHARFLFAAASASGKDAWGKNQPERHPEAEREPVPQRGPRTGSPCHGSPAGSLLYVASGTRGPRAQWEERDLVQLRHVCHRLRPGRRSGSGLLMAASSRIGPSSDAPAHTARARVHAAGTDVHAQLHMCACPNRPSCSLGWASRLSQHRLRPAPCRVSGRAQPGPSSRSSPGTATASGTRPPDLPRRFPRNVAPPSPASHLTLLCFLPS